MYILSWLNIIFATFSRERRTTPYNALLSIHEETVIETYRKSRNFYISPEYSNTHANFCQDRSWQNYSVVKKTDRRTH